MFSLAKIMIDGVPWKSMAFDLSIFLEKYGQIFVFPDFCPCLVFF